MSSIEPIQVEHLTKDYGGGHGVFDVSFRVQKGQVMGFLGSNGAGKTVTMRHLMGFIRPQSGQVRVFGLDPFSNRKQTQQRIGYLPGEISMDESLTGADFLKFMARMNGLGNLRRMHELIEMFELDPNIKIGRMSKGTKQKVGLVTACMGKPDLLLLDEPTSGLDPLMQNRFIDLVLEEQARGATIFLSSHIFEEVERTCSQVAFIRAGRIAAVEDMGAVKAERSTSFTVRFASRAQQTAYLASRGSAPSEGAGSCTAIDDRSVRVSVRGRVDAFIKDLAGYQVEDLQSQTQSLEDAFMGFYGAGPNGASGPGVAADNSNIASGTGNASKQED